MNGSLNKQIEVWEGEGGAPARSYALRKGRPLIHDWQEIGHQVRPMIFHDARYQAIKSNSRYDDGFEKRRLTAS